METEILENGRKVPIRWFNLKLNSRQLVAIKQLIVERVLLNEGQLSSNDLLVSWNAKVTLTCAEINDLISEIFSTPEKFQTSR